MKNKYYKNLDFMLSILLLIPALFIAAFLKYVEPVFDNFELALPLSWIVYSALIGINLLLFYFLVQKFISPEIKKSQRYKHSYYPDYIPLIFFYVSLILFIDVCCVGNKNLFNIVFAATAGLIALMLIVLRPRKQINFANLTRKFANGSRKSSEDKLEFKDSAKNAANGILELKNCVSVVTLKGGYGEGKSSYTRMMIESFKEEELLYSYISLTEANETRDFSKLFAERWFETLKERYPIFNFVPHLESLDSVLRESGSNGPLLSAIANLLVKFNFSLNKTKIKCDDEEIRYSNKNISTMFGHIPEIIEKCWVIVIDEIERAQFDEIYRVIEVIERFKNEASYNEGLPVKLVFFLCLSPSDLEKRVNDWNTLNEKASLIRDFFFNDPKSCDENLILPPVSYSIKKLFIRDSLKQVLEKLEWSYKGKDLKSKYKEEALKKLDEDDILSDQPMHRFYNKWQALSWIVNSLLLNESPRVIGKLCQEIAFFYSCFRDLNGNKAYFEDIALCDVIIVSYVKIKYPLIIQFLKIFCSNDLQSYPDYRDKDVFQEIQKDKKIDNNPKYYLQKRLELFRVDLAVNDLITNLIGIISFQNCNPLAQDSSIHGAELGRTSFFDDRTLMVDVLTLVFSGQKSHVIHQIFTSQTPIWNASNNELVEYASRLTRTGDSTWNQHLEVANELLQRFEGLTKFTLLPTGQLFGQGEYDSAVYRFLFAISSAIEKSNNWLDASTHEIEHQKIWDCVKQFLESKKISIGAKYIILNAFINESRRTSETNARLVSNFNTLTLSKEDEVKKLIKNVFIDADDRYFSGEKSVYENEENFSYTLFQSWNGKDNDDNLGPIRMAAKRGLEFWPKAIDYYWSVYYDRNSEEQNLEMISIKDLLEITEKAVSITEDQDFKNILEKRVRDYVSNPHHSYARVFKNYRKDEAYKPLMLAMIDLGKVSEEVSLFARRAARVSFIKILNLKIT